MPFSIYNEVLETYVNSEDFTPTSNVLEMDIFATRDQAENYLNYLKKENLLAEGTEDDYCIGILTYDSTLELVVELDPAPEEPFFAIYVVDRGAFLLVYDMQTVGYSDTLTRANLMPIAIAESLIYAGDRLLEVKIVNNTLYIVSVNKW
jgi:hypothetical protein